MKIEVFNKAKELQDTISSLKKIINDAEKKRHWISLVSACYKNEYYSADFYKRLLNFAKQMLAKYEKEFEDLEDCKSSENKSKVYAVDFDGTLCINGSD